MTRRQGHNQVALAGEKQIAVELKGVRPLLPELNESLIDLGDGAGGQKPELLSKSCRTRVQFGHFSGANWIF